MTPLAVRWCGSAESPADLERPAAWLLGRDDPAARELAEAAPPTPEDLADAALFASPARRAGRLWRRCLLRALAARCLGCAPEGLEIVRSAAGAPSIVAPRRLCVSLSAQAGWILIGLCLHPLGVDLEPDLPVPVPAAALHPAEAAALERLDEDLRFAAFLRIWTAKEAALKALGRGLLEDPAQLETRFEGDHGLVLREGRALARVETRRQAGLATAVAVLEKRPRS